VANNRGRRARVAGVAAQVAGVIWMLQWSHSLVTHGPTQVDRQQVWLGMTWFDSGKFLGLAFLLLIPGVLLLRRRADGQRAAHVLGGVLAGALVLAAVGTALDLAVYPWGSYSPPDATVTALAGPAASLARGVVLPLAWVAFGAYAARAPVLPAWLLAVLVIGSASSFFGAGPLPPVPGVACLVFGGWLLTRADDATRDVRAVEAATP
jgi:hypothetical protein